MTDLRDEVAAKFGIPSSQAHRLIGTNRDELEADARELVSVPLGFDPSRLRDHQYYLEHRAEVDAAWREGRLSEVNR